MHAIALLQAAIALLTTLSGMGGSVPDDLRAQVLSVANSAIVEANYEITHSSMTDTSPVTDTTAASTDTSPAATPAASAPAPQYRIEIVSPFPGKGLGRSYYVAPPGVTTWDTAPDEKYTISLGAVLYGPDGTDDRTSVMQVTATDDSQDKTIDGTGDLWGNPHNVYYYFFGYVFKTPGDHTITFSSHGVSQSVTVHVNE